MFLGTASQNLNVMQIQTVKLDMHVKITNVSINANCVVSIKYVVEAFVSLSLSALLILNVLLASNVLLTNALINVLLKFVCPLKNVNLETV